jgi:hypothetical protein
VPQPQVEWCAAVALQAELAVSQIVLQQREADFLKKEAEHNNKVGWLHAKLSVQLSHKQQIHGASEVGMWLLTFHCLFLWANDGAAGRAGSLAVATHAGAVH